MASDLRWTPEQLAAWKKKQGGADRAAAAPAPLLRPTLMNKTESAYAETLEEWRRGGRILSWDFEAVKLKLAPKTFYTPDFFVVFPGHFAFHEVKGFWRDDARVKIKVAAERFPAFQFTAITRAGRDWSYEHFSGGGCVE